MNLTLCLTHDCNLRCAYCYAGRKFPRAMSWDTALRALEFGVKLARDEARLAGRKPRWQLGFFGGEPLLEWDLLQRATDRAGDLAAAEGMDLTLTVTTNATLLDPDRIRWLKTRKFHVGLSVDGDAAMHDLLRRDAGGRGSHAAAAAALDAFRGPDAGAEVIVVVDPRNAARLPAALDWLVSRDLRSISLNPNFSADWSPEARRHWRHGYAHAGRLYLRGFRERAPLTINVLESKIRTRLKDGYAPCDRCKFGEGEVAVAPGGALYPCERLVGDDTLAALRLGDVRTGFDPDAWRRITAARGNRDAACRDCALAPRCMNWCGCVNYATTGATDRVSGLVCFHERLSIAIADRVAEILYAESNPLFLSRFYRL